MNKNISYSFRAVIFIFSCILLMLSFSYFSYADSDVEDNPYAPYSDFEELYEAYQVAVSNNDTALQEELLNIGYSSLRYEIEQSESTMTIPESLLGNKVSLRYDPLEQYYVQTVFPSYFSYGYFETRSDGVTLSLGNTKSYWSPEDKAEGWTATYMKFRNNSNWNNTNIMQEQFYCHARVVYAYLEQEWNLEPWRTSMNPITCN